MDDQLALDLDLVEADLVEADVVEADVVVEHADALDWLARQQPGAARAIIYYPPYSRGRADARPG